MRMHLLVPVIVATACGIEPSDEMVDELGETEHALNGDTWINSDLLQPAPYASLYDAAIGSQHEIYAVGSKNLGSTWAFRTSTNGGITYSDGPTFSLAGGRAAATEIAVDHIGRIIVAGHAVDLNDQWHVVIRLSTDQGASFTTVDNVSFPVGQIRSASSISVDEQGRFTVAINGIDAPSLLRQSGPGGTAWSTIPNPTSTTKIRGLCRTSAGLVGTGQASSTSSGVTYRYANGTWTLLDTFHPAVHDTGWQCTEVGGALYVAGKSSTNVIVRRSTNAGATWSTVDSIPAINIQEIGPGPNGRVYYVGQGEDAMWLVRRTSNGTTWLDSDNLTHEAALGFAYDPVLGNMTVVGDDGQGGQRGNRRLKH